MRHGTRSQRRSIRGLRKTSGLRLTSMMDILTVLLLFLLKSFVVDGEAMTPRAGVDLPESSAEERPESSVVVAVSADGIVVGDEPVATMAEVLASDDLYVVPLAERLEEVWLQREELARLRGETELEAPAATIQGDRDIEFRVLERVMYTLGETGFGDVSLAVIKKS